MESVGAMFGLTREQLSNAKLVYLGKDETAPRDTELIRLLFDEYGQRKWYVGQLVLALNFQLASTLSAFDAYLLLAGQRFVEFGFASGEELEFIGDVIQELASIERLPLLTALNVLEWCSNLEAAFKRNNEGLSESSGDPLLTLAGRVALLANTLLDKLGQASPELNSVDDETPVCVRVTFDEKPDIPLTELLNSLATQSNVAKLGNSHQIRFELGSYSEIVLTTLSSLMAFQAFLFLINGCVIQLTELKHRTKVLVRKKGPKSYRDIALSPVQSASPIVLSVLTGLMEYAKGLGWLRHPGLSGYAASNIRSVQVVDCDDQVTDNVPGEGSSGDARQQP
jgi:hypothetical protein